MRAYLPVSVADLQQLSAGEAVSIEGFVASSTDEEDELAALETAAEAGAVVAVVEVDDPDGPVTLDDVDAFHAAVDDSGDLAWFARQEVAAVIDAVG